MTYIVTTYQVSNRSTSPHLPARVIAPHIAQDPEPESEFRVTSEIKTAPETTNDAKLFRNPSEKPEPHTDLVWRQPTVRFQTGPLFTTPIPDVQAQKQVLEPETRQLPRGTRSQTRNICGGTDAQNQGRHENDTDLAPRTRPAQDHCVKTQNRHVASPDRTFQPPRCNALPLEGGSGAK